MLYRSLLVLVLVAVILVPVKFFSFAENDNICSSAKLKSTSPVEQQVACLHFRLNQLVDNHFTLLKYFVSPEYSEVRTASIDKAILGPVEEDIKIMLSSGPDAEPVQIATCSKTTRVKGLSFPNLTSKCLLDAMITEYIRVYQQVGRERFFIEQNDVILMSIETAVNFYTQMLMVYPMHQNFLAIEEELLKTVETLKLSSNILETIPNKFTNATTTECQ